MSNKQTTINLVPPGRLHKEGFVSKGHVCGYCHGRGWFYGPLGTNEPVVCPDCGGTGEVVAFVTVDWKPRTKGGNV